MLLGDPELLHHGYLSMCAGRLPLTSVDGGHAVEAGHGGELGHVPVSQLPICVPAAKGGRRLRRSDLQVL